MNDSMGVVKYKPLIKQIVQKLFDARRPELDDIEFRSHGLKDFLKTGFGYTNINFITFDKIFSFQYFIGEIFAVRCLVVHNVYFINCEVCLILFPNSRKKRRENSLQKME